MSKLIQMEFDFSEKKPVQMEFDFSAKPTEAPKEGNRV